MKHFQESRQDCCNIHTFPLQKSSPPFFFFFFQFYFLFRVKHGVLVATCNVPGFKVKFMPLFACQYFCSIPEGYCILLCHCRSPACFVNLSLAKIYFRMIQQKGEKDFEENRSGFIVLRRQKKKYMCSCTGYSKDSLKYSPPDQCSASRKC